MIPTSPLETLRDSIATRIGTLAGLAPGIPVITRRELDFLNRIEQLAAHSGMVVLVHLLSARELGHQAAQPSYEASIMVQTIENPSLWQVAEDRPGGWSVAAAVESWIKLAPITVGDQTILLQQERELEEEATTAGLFIVSAIYKCRLSGVPQPAPAPAPAPDPEPAP